MEAAEEVFQMSSLEADESVEDNDDLKDVNGFEKDVNASAMKEITNLDEEHLDDSRAVLTSIDEYPQSSIIDVSEHSGDQVKITNAVELEPIILPANNTDDFIADSELQDLVQSIVHKVETILEHVNCEGLKSDEGEHGLESNDAVNVVEGSVTSQENVDPTEAQESVVESDNSGRIVHEAGTDDGLNEAAHILDSGICDESPKDEKIESNKVVEDKTIIETVAGASHSAHCSGQDLENKEVAELLDETIEAVIAGSEVSKEPELVVQRNEQEAVLLEENKPDEEQIAVPSPAMPTPIMFDSSTELTTEKEQELEKELEEMESETVSDEILKAVNESIQEKNESVHDVVPPENVDPVDVDQVSTAEPRQKPSVILSTHDLSEIHDYFILTESEMQLGKTKPYWIPDDDCNCCMLCSARFTVINRRHHCRCCGRVLCNSCCSIKRSLPYIEDDKKQKICEPCSRTLDRIEDYERLQAQRLLQEQNYSVEKSENRDIPNDLEAGPSTPRASTTPSSFSRKKSVLKSKKTETAEDGGGVKRSVQFLDGIRPGHENETSENHVQVEEDPEVLRRKAQKKQNSSRRNRERRIDEEQISLLKEDFLCLADCDAKLEKVSTEDICRRLLDGEKLSIAVKKNYWVVSQLVQTIHGNKVWCFSSRGMNFIGTDELLISFELNDADISDLEGTIKSFESGEENERRLDQKPSFIHSVLYLFEQLFIEALMPANENLDEKVGIRKCGLRMNKFYRVPTGEIGGIPVAAILFHRPQGQDFGNLPIPPHVPFLIGAFVLKPEIVWAITIPNRLLLRLGLQASHFPVPVVNKRNRDPVYNDTSENTVLKVFNDFRNWSYRLSRILGSTVEIEGGCLIKVHIPTYATEELKQVVESNRNMLAWCTELTEHPDSHLVAIQNPDSTFRTEIFTDVGGTRQTIGANFIIIDGSLKSSNEKFIMTIIEDGVVLRFSSETMEEIVKNLLNGTVFSIDSQSMSVQIMFVDPNEPQSKTGALISPIDEVYLLGHFQYGLTLTRQFRSMIMIPNTTEWALRLSTVINADSGRFPIQLQPRYFEICEQIGTLMAGTVEQFILPLTLSEQRQLCIRLRIESDLVTYETAKWHDLEQEHYSWTAILDDKLIPYLYQICPMISCQLYIELYFSIICTRLLPNFDY
uniref:FYVE-type domain-containing protein n=1 Tax=Panagrolaimus sp. JU765 TaxID=591449 RepID=A0AC34QMP6_9BILA